MSKLLITGGTGFIGKSSEINRLTNSLQVDISFTRKILNWSPPLTVQEGIRRMVPYN